jgi:serine/threonine protein kinase
MPLTPGTRLSHFEIVSALGAGGMGEVYRAQDTALERQVALKVLPAPMVTDDTRLVRFRREAKALAALSHPNIVTIFSVDHEQGIYFFTMELVEGKRLADLIPERGLPLARLLQLAIPLADALGAAHDKGIVHRDLKPANVMIDTADRLKVLDFGLAKAAMDRPSVDTMSTQLTSTEQGVVRGTLPYMAPEQLCLEPSDARGDVFSFGVVLYELATGALPFAGDSPALLMSAILRDDPPPVTERRADLPRRLAYIVSRCLEKRPRDRYQTMRDVQDDLQALSSLRADETVDDAKGVKTTAQAPRSIVVRSWRLTTPDPDLQIFSSGLVEDVANGLSRFSYLSIAAGDVASVRYSLEGSLQRVGSTIRVGVQLIDASSGTRLWAETYDRDIGGRTSFAVQDELTDRIVATVADVYGVLVHSMFQSIRGMAIDSLSSPDLLLRYWAYMRNPKREEHARLRSALEGAVMREPNNPDVWAALAYIYGQEYAHGLNPLPDSLSRSAKAARTSVELEPGSQHGWNALAAVHFFSRDRDAFVPAADRAVSLNPRNTNTAASMALYLVHSGDGERAAQMIHRAMRLNPHHPGWYHTVDFHCHYLAGRDQDAYAAIKKVNMPDLALGHMLVAAVCGQLGRAEEARTAINAIQALEPALLHAGIRSEMVRRWIWTAGHRDRVLEGFTKALELAAG